MTTRMTAIRTRLRQLLDGPKTEEAAEEARRLVAEYRGDAPVSEAAKPRRAEPTEVELEAARWRKVIAMRRGGGASTVIWSPGGGRDYEPAWTAQNEAKTYLRRSSPWR